MRCRANLYGFYSPAAVCYSSGGSQHHLKVVSDGHAAPQQQQQQQQQRSPALQHSQQQQQHAPQQQGPHGRASVSKQAPGGETEADLKARLLADIAREDQDKRVQVCALILTLTLTLDPLRASPTLCFISGWNPPEPHSRSNSDVRLWDSQRANRLPSC